MIEPDTNFSRNGQLIVPRSGVGVGQELMEVFSACAAFPVVFGYINSNVILKINHCCNIGNEKY